MLYRSDFSISYLAALHNYIREEPQSGNYTEGSAPIGGLNTDNMMTDAQEQIGVDNSEELRNAPSDF